MGRTGSSRAIESAVVPYTAWFAVRLGLAVVTAYRSIILAIIIIEGILHTNKFTYWNYVLQWFFDLAYLLATFTEGRFLVFLTLYFLPMVFGSTILVSILIVIIIQRNDWEYIESTIFGIGEYKVGDIHSADWVVHVAPLVARFVILYLGQQAISHAIISNLFENRRERLFSGTWKSSTKFRLYLVWWVFSPLLPLLVFTIFYDPLKEYPTDFTVLQALAIVLAINTVAQLITFLGITANNEIDINLDPSGECKSSSSSYRHHRQKGTATPHHHHHCHQRPLHGAPVGVISERHHGDGSLVLTTS